MDDLTRDLFIRGMLAAKNKETADARRYLEWALRLDPPQETRVDILYWLAQVAETPDEQRQRLEEALAFDPGDMRCRRALAVLRGELKPEEIIDPDRIAPAGPAVTPTGARSGGTPTGAVSPAGTPRASGDTPAPEGRASARRNTGPLADRLSSGPPDPSAPAGTRSESTPTGAVSPAGTPRASGDTPAPEGRASARRKTGPLTARQSAGSLKEQRSVDRFTCPQCGGRMTFAPDGQALTCEYCESRQSTPSGAPATDAAAAENFLIAMATRKGHLHPTTRQTFNCQGCGVDFWLTPQQLSITCPYCGSAYAVRRGQSRELIDPHLILPFTVDEKQAEQALRGWLAPPRGARSGVEQNLAANVNPNLERAAAMYLPAWSFEMAGQVPWSCMVEERRDRWVVETGSEIVYHTSVLVAASTHLSADCAAELNAFDFKQGLPFDERYLANWPAETYQVPVGDASLEARHWTYEFEKQSVRQRMMRKVRDLTFNSLGITVEAFQLVLLPLWLAHYRVGEKRYEVVVNGRSAAVRGQRPQNWLEKLLRK